ncbi:hypothetical protein KTE71_13225 [Burkholderia multivorans]|nr:hypothetical protein [Burkholderia multivorans]MBR8020788.1 hypothetical protein [Burkholderia multivorans]MBU9227285.1 hypothetical protein [Burkholderia multivorans]MBU9388480.1 hypothetical protein [Burkholderia multivorans]MDN8031162.1 hypothetical protein [Burkholderia multivorans]HEF4732919.1 hypothetical protein [Burkholderia multivorans]
MQTILAFLNGIREFRFDCTTGYDDDDLMTAYDHGRELAHRLTFRRFEHA